MADTVAAVLTLARAHLDDPDGASFQDQVLIPFVASAYRRLQRRLAENGIKFTSAEATVNVPAGTTEVADGGGAALPSDFLIPHKLWEKGTGTSEKYVPMVEEIQALPDYDRTSQLRFWHWEGDKILLLGATRDVTVKIYYEKALVTLSQKADPIVLRDAVDALACRAAALAARARLASALAGSLAFEADEYEREIINRHTRAKQHRPQRRRPYGWRGYRGRVMSF